MRHDIYRKMRICAAFAAAAAFVAALVLATCGDDGNPAGTSDGDGTGGKIDTIAHGKYVWMAKNLNVKTDSSWCYNNDLNNCAKFGRLYTWNAAMKACSLLGDGWRLPTAADWDSLINDSTHAGRFDWTNAGRNMKALTGWIRSPHDDSLSRIDTVGFRGLPGGYRSWSHGREIFYRLGMEGRWWSSEEDNDGTGGAYSRIMVVNNDNVRRSNTERILGHSVRCVRDSLRVDTLHRDSTRRSTSRILFVGND